MERKTTPAEAVSLPAAKDGKDRRPRSGGHRHTRQREPGDVGTDFVESAQWHPLPPQTFPAAANPGPNPGISCTAAPVNGTCQLLLTDVQLAFTWKRKTKTLSCFTWGFFLSVH